MSKSGKTWVEIARKYFPEVPDRELQSIIWGRTGFPSFFETDDIEACFRQQLQDEKDGRESWEASKEGR